MEGKRASIRIILAIGCPLSPILSRRHGIREGPSAIPSFPPPRFCGNKGKADKTVDLNVS
jgi:hypothetical protein